MTLDPLTAVTQLMEPKLGDLGDELSKPSAVIRDGLVDEALMWWTLLKVLERNVSSHEIRKRLKSLSDGIFSKIHHVGDAG
jgi:hypothetical protein